MSSARFGDSQLRQAGKGLLLPLLQPLHALRIFQLPVGATPFQQLADGIGQLSLTESRKIGDDLAHQIQFAGGEHAPAERNGLFQVFRSPTAAADAATSRVGHPEEKVQRNLTRLLYGANGQSPDPSEARTFTLTHAPHLATDQEYSHAGPDGRGEPGPARRVSLRRKSTRLNS